MKGGETRKSAIYTDTAGKGDLRKEQETKSKILLGRCFRNIKILKTD